jgi:acetyl-CoA carboxylase beta subunit
MDDNKELNFDQLEEVNGGTGIQEFPNKLNINLRQLNANKAAGQTEPASLDPMEGVNVNTDAVECPKCHSIAVKLDLEANTYICQDCGNIVTLGK